MQMFMVDFLDKCGRICSIICSYSVVIISETFRAKETIEMKKLLLFHKLYFPAVGGEVNCNIIVRIQTKYCCNLAKYVI